MRGDDLAPIIRLADVAEHREGTLVLKSSRRVVAIVPDGRLMPQKQKRIPTSRARRIVAILLIPALFLQPMVRVYAEDGGITVTTAPITESTPQPEPLPEPITETPPTPTEAPTDVPTIFDVDALLSDAGDAGSTTDANGTTTDAEPAVDVVGDTATTTEEATATSTEEVAPPEESGTSTEEVLQEPVVEEEVPIDEEPVEEIPPEELPIISETPAPSIDEIIRAKEEQFRAELRKQVEEEFTRGCLQVDSIGYYCLKGETPQFSGDLSPSSAVASTRADVDDRGTDKEIFVTRRGEELQVTYNEWEDAFPARDLSGKFVVWQGQKDGRWQIFVASFASDTPRITQLTNGSESNFNPRVENGVVVWQSWVNDNWEVFLARPHEGIPREPESGVPPENLMLGIGPDWDVTRLTENPSHDMFPAIAGDVVTWQRAEDGSWTIYAYSMKTNVTTRVSEQGGKGERPRFAMVWEQRDAEGTAHLMGYDIASGENVDLTKEAKNIPYEQKPYIPQSPITADDQASLPLVSATSTAKTGDEEGDGGGDGAGNTNASSTLP